jgi:hypothetical protein
MFASNTFAVCGIFVVSFAASPTIARAQDNGRTRLPNTGIAPITYSSIPVRGLVRHATH